MSEINKEISRKTGLRVQAVEKFLRDNNLDNLKLLTDLGHKKIQPIDLSTAISGKPGNEYAKLIIQRYMKESKVEILKRMIREEVRKVRLKEDSFNDEVEELAIQLIDYLGAGLPATGWKTNPRIFNWFKENGIKINTPIAQDIYRRALELNQDNEPKSRKYLDN